MTEEQLIWAAGILEGEGTFGYSETETTKYTKRKRKLRVRLSMTDLDIIVRIRNILNPGGSIRLDKRSEQTFKDGYTRKDAYICSIEGEKAAIIMRAILPYMGNRRRQRIEDSLYKWENNRRGPVYTPPTQDEIDDAASALQDIGL